MNSAHPIISIVIPLFCEADHVRNSLSEISVHVSSLNLSHEYLLVDDGSTDRTWDEIRLLAREFPETSGLRLSRNFGKEAAISAGIRHSRGDAVIVMDSDLQHPPDLIPELIRIWNRGEFDVVDGIKSSRGKESISYKLSAGLFNRLMCTLSGFNLEGASDFKLLDRKVVDAWLSMGESSTFYRGMTEWVGFKHYRLPFDVRERNIGTSTWSFFRLIRLAINALTSFTSLPLHLVTLMGFLFMFLAGFLGCLTLVQWIRGTAVAGFSTVILLQLIIGGIIMLSLGIAGQYIAQIYYEVKQRPRYLIQDTCNVGNRTIVSSPRIPPEAAHGEG